MQVAESLLNDEPAKGRVLQSVYFIISNDPKSYDWVQSYMAKNPQSRVPIVFNKKDIIENAPHDPWYIRNTISKQLYSRDLFNYQLPIDNDLYFFGRESLIASYIDSIKSCKNIGLFGLRKTGKTSILYKIQRIFQREKIGLYIYLDAKLPSVRALRWFELLEKINTAIRVHYGLKADSSFTEKTASEKFIITLQKVPDKFLTCLVFDEIEYISPMAKLDQHWHSDFIPFWQTLWSAQSQIRSLANIVAGVNPSVAEVDTFDGVQNPMFGVVFASYLKGLDLQDLKKMLRFFGKRMGLNFSEGASGYLFKRYGGHPLLTRLACSYIHEDLIYNKIDRPFTVTSNYLKENEKERENEIQFYCRHVVSEIKLFYPDEYEMLELLASGQTIDFMELSLDPDLVRHLKNYGLIDNLEGKKPSFALPVVGRYIGLEYARSEKRTFQKHIVEKKNRLPWLNKRVQSIISDLRLLENLIVSNNNTPSLYGEASFKEPERFSSIQCCESHDDFVVFINICNRSFVEPIENYGKTAHNDSSYFWKTIKTNYPYLWEALHRIKVYRNNDLHIELRQSVENDLKQLIELDLEGKRITQVEDVWFRLQQCVLDELLTGIVCEINQRN
jgi:hypothetical protein